MNLKRFLLVEDSHDGVINDLVAIVLKKKPNFVVFKNKEKVKVLKVDAEILVATYNNMTTTQRKRFDDLISKNKRNFNNTLNTIYRSITKK